MIHGKCLWAPQAHHMQLLYSFVILNFIYTLYKYYCLNLVLMWTCNFELYLYTV